MTITTIPDEALTIVKDFEGYRDKPYKCPAGKLTIGYGHVLKTNEKISSLTTPVATSILKEDLSAALDVVNKYVKVYLLQNQLSSLLSFIYNIGEPQFKTSTMLKKLNNGDYPGAAKEFKRWKFIGKKVSDGLVNRRQKEYELFIKDMK